MDITLDFEAMRHDYEQDRIMDVEEAVKQVLGKIDHMVKTADDPEELIEHLGSLADTAKGHRRDLRDRQPVAALGSGSSSSTASSTSSGSTGSDSNAERLNALALAVGISADQFLNWAGNMFEGLKGLGQEQLQGRSIAMQQIADGTIPVKNDGSLKLEDDKKSLERQLQSLQAFQPAAASLQNLDDSEKNKRLKGINKVASGDLKVKNDGSADVSSPAPAPAPSSSSQEEKAKASMFDDVASNCEQVGFRGLSIGHKHWQLNFDALKDETFKALTGDAS